MTFICILLMVVCILWMSLLVPGRVFSFELPLIVETDNILNSLFKDEHFFKCRPKFVF